MKTFARYFGYISKKAILRTAIFTLLGLAIVWIAAQSGIDNSNYYTWQDKFHDFRVTNIGTISTVLGFACGLIPIFELAAFKNRRNLDTLYFFPIRRWKMGLAHYLSGLLQITTVHSVCFFISLALYIVKTNYFALEYMIPYFFASLGLGIITYSIFMFINAQANTVVDGVLFSILWLFALFIFFGMVISVIEKATGDSSIIYESGILNWTIFFSPLNNVTVIFQKLIHVNRTDDYMKIAREYASQLYMVAFWIILGIGAIAGYFLTFIKKGAQKAGEVSDTFVGYRVLIPLYCIMVSSTFISFPIMQVIVMAMTIVGYVIFRRGFKFKLPDILSIVGSVLTSIVISAFLNS